MNLSNEQVALLKQIKNNELPSGNEFYNHNELLQDLVHKDLVNFNFVPNSDRQIDTYVLTTEGQNQLSLHSTEIVHHYQNVSSNIISGIGGAIVGALITYFLMI